MNIEKYIKTSAEIPLNKKTIIHLMLVNNMIKEIIGEGLKSFDVSMQQYNVLRILRGQKGNPANLSTINERMISKMSNTSRLVDKLIAKKLVCRAICESNRRKVEIVITEEGLASLEKMDNVINKAEHTITSKLNTKELETLNILLNKF
ncbi:MarR family transcriptional regulator [Flavobacteriaceae bacterium R38]|nr:MarR family transcriptional regulator [Flavobacteriaceae bacterium R38]